MTDTIIKINSITKDYKQQRGIFDIDLEIKKGECFGYVGTNGSGKTTTIRSIMGFIRTDKGNVEVNGLDAWQNAVDIKEYVSYVPGEIAFPPFKTGMDFLKKQATYLGISDLSYMYELLDIFKLDATANLARMSKGMKQKTALVAALMADRDILIMDEPTTGLDPLMREVFIDLINKEKKSGKTIFISNHIFEEVEELCDRVAFIKDGRIIDVVDMEEMRENHRSTFYIGFNDSEEELKLTLARGQAAEPFDQLKDRDVKFIDEEAYTLEDYFNEAYRKGQK